MFSSLGSTCNLNVQEKHLQCEGQGAGAPHGNHGTTSTVSLKKPDFLAVFFSVAVTFLNRFPS